VPLPSFLQRLFHFLNREPGTPVGHSLMAHLDSISVETMFLPDTVLFPRGSCKILSFLLRLIYRNALSHFHNRSTTRHPPYALKVTFRHDFLLFSYNQFSARNIYHMMLSPSLVTLINTNQNGSNILVYKCAIISRFKFNCPAFNSVTWHKPPGCDC